MASSSSRSSSAAKQYDVFISFRGEDTRHNFTSHLYSALSRYSIRTYIDYELNKGHVISPVLLQAIQDSYGSLVVFSQNYAFSKWCLNELLKILECRKQGHFVIPVFYKIDPSHVRKQIASYGEAFAKHEQDSNISKETLHKWKDALSEAANIVGWDSESRINRDESELIQNIVKDILQKLDHIYQSSESGLVGIDKHCEHIESLLQRSPVVGIWGMGGIGKTTIARATFDKLCSQYDSCCFFENVREESHRSGMNQLRDKLLFALLKDDIIPINPHKAIGLKHAMQRLSSEKVFIVLDDVTSSKQLEHLGSECNFLGPDSRIIITTRDKHLLTSLRVKHAIHEVRGLSFEESLELFRLNAFNENYPEIGYEEITKKFVSYSKGTPLALKVLGSFLLSKSRDEWESAWNKLNKIPHEEIEKVLRLSFDGLDREDQQIFLDIACFLKGWNKENVISLLDNYGFHGAIGLRTLQDRALITISNYHIVQMHDLIEGLGWEIVRKESIGEPGRRSRLWDFEEVYDVLKYNKGTDAVQGIILDMSQIKDLHLSIDTFQKMINLRFLKFYSPNYLESGKVHLPTNIPSFPDKLRYLQWDIYPLKSLPSTFCTEKLVEFHMPHSHIKNLWNGVQDLVNLKCLNLSGSEQLMELPDFSKASSLKSVILSGCTNLCHLHPSILSLHTLETLDVCWCKNLRSLQGDAHLKSLKYLEISGCSSLKEFSLSSEKIKELHIGGTAIEILHSSIGHCSNLEYLSLYGSIKNLPNDLSKLTSLEYFHVRGCRELDTVNLPMILGSFKSLREITLTDCFNLSQLPDGIERFRYLRRLDLRNCRRLTYIPELGESITDLRVSNCTSLETIITPTISPMLFQRRDYRYLLINCVELDEHSLFKIIGFAYYKIKQAALPRAYDSGSAHNFLLPGNEVPSGFKYRTTQNWITIEIPSRSHLLGFAFCCIFSPELLPNQGEYLSKCGCYCYLEDSQFTQFPSFSFDSVEYELDMKLISDHVYIWYSQADCYKLFDAMKEQRAKGQSTNKLSFEFYVYANERQNIRTENAIKECGVWPIYASEYNESINELELSLGFKLGYRTHDIDERHQFFDPTSENFKLSLLPMELEFDELGLSAVGTGVASSVFDHQDIMQNARQDLPEINSLYLLNRELDNVIITEECEVLPVYASEYENSMSQRQVSLESGFGNKSKRSRDMDRNQQLQRKKFNRCQDIDELFGGASISGIGVGHFEFDHVNHYELQPLTHTNTMNEFVFQPLTTDIFKQNASLELTQINSKCLLNRLIEFDNSIMQFDPTWLCPDFNEMATGDHSLGVDQQSPSLPIWVNRGIPPNVGANCGLCVPSSSSSLPEIIQMGQANDVLGSSPLSNFGMPSSEYQNSINQMDSICQYELEAYHQQPLPLTYESELYTTQPIATGLEAKSMTSWDTEGIGGFHHENQHQQAQLVTGNGIDRICFPSTSNWNPDAK